MSSAWTLDSLMGGAVRTSTTVVIATLQMKKPAPCCLSFADEENLSPPSSALPPPRSSVEKARFDCVSVLRGLVRQKRWSLLWELEVGLRWWEVKWM